MNRRAAISVLSCGAVALLTVSTSASPAEKIRRDGNWWVNLTEFSKSFYILGFLDGMELGNDFSYWGLETKDTLAVMPKVIKAYVDYVDRYTSNVTVGQITEGLDKFYGDFRNRSIATHGGVWIVLRQISGDSDAEIQKLIESWRKNAGKE